MVGRAFCKGGDEVRPVSVAVWSRRANRNLRYGVNSGASNILFGKGLPIAVDHCPRQRSNLIGNEKRPSLTEKATRH